MSPKNFIWCRNGKWISVVYKNENVKVPSDRTKVKRENENLIDVCRLFFDIFLIVI